MSRLVHTVKTLGVFNQKGGVGKTTVTAIVAEYLALKYNKKVLLIDSDMQCNTSDYWVGMEPAQGVIGGQLPPRHPDYDPDHPDSEYVNERSTIADIFYGLTVMPYGTYIDGGGETGPGLVDVLLGHPEKLETVNTEFDNKSGEIERRVTNQMALFLHDDPSIEEAYDIVIIDTGPSRNPVFRAAMRASTHALIPFEPEAKSLQGINAMLQAVQAENYARTSDTQPLKLLGLLPNKVRRMTNLHKQTMQQIQKIAGNRMAPPEVYLPNAVAYPQRDMKGANPKTIFGLPESTVARKQAEVVGEWIYGLMFGPEKALQSNGTVTRSPEATGTVEAAR